jgi:hypothetical protein
MNDWAIWVIGALTAHIRILLGFGLVAFALLFIIIPWLLILDCFGVKWAERVLRRLLDSNTHR